MSPSKRLLIAEIVSIAALSIAPFGLFHLLPENPKEETRTLKVGDPLGRSCSRTDVCTKCRQKKTGTPTPSRNDEPPAEAGNTF